MAAASIDALLNQLRYVNRKRVSDDVNALTREYRTLIPRVVDFVHDNGAQSKLIVLSGTIPILYGGVQYNIPVDLFVAEGHPREAPKLYVRPTSNMTVKHNHQHVSANGLCYLPYLNEWTERSNLVGLVEIASSVFSIEPPLFSKPTGTAAAAVSSSTTSTYAPYGGAATPTVTTAQYPSASTYSTGPPTGPVAMGLSVTGAGYGAPGVYEAYGQTMAPAAYATATPASPTAATLVGAAAFSATATAATPATVAPSQAPRLTPSGSNGALRAEEEKRLQLVDQVTMRLYEAIDQKQRRLRDELDTHIADGSRLDRSAEACASTLLDLQQTRGMHSEAIAAMTAKSAEFEAWSAEEGNRAALPAVDRLVPFDPLSAQIVRLHSEVNAIDDAFYFLERALASSRNESVDLTTFLKECRGLARRQFLSKAHLRKISAHCLQLEADRVAEQARQAPIPQQTQSQQQQSNGYAAQSRAMAAGMPVGHAYSGVPYPVTAYP